MSRITLPSRENTLAAAQPLLDAVEKQLGMVPNLFRLIALSPATLKGYLDFSGALARTLDVKTRERIAIAVAQANGCDYCLSAHSFIGLNMARIDSAEIARNRDGHSADPRADAAVVFALKLVRERGQLRSTDVGTVRAAGFSDAPIVEIVALVAENIFTNYLNIVADTEIDFPVVLTRETV